MPLFRLDDDEDLDEDEDFDEDDEEDEEDEDDDEKEEPEDDVETWQVAGTPLKRSLDLTFRHRPA